MSLRTVDPTFTIEQWSAQYNLLASDVGSIAALNTPITTSAVTALNSVFSDLTAYKTEVGALTTINAAIRGASFAVSINNFYSAYLGWAAPATALTTNANTASGAINELKTRVDTNQTNIGTLASLTTTAKGSVVLAVNELKGRVDTNQTNIGTLSTINAAIRQSNLSSTIQTFYAAYLAWAAPGTALMTVAQTASGGINELKGRVDTNQTNIGTLASLTTTAKGSAVAAINELKTRVDTNQTNIGTLSTIDATIRQSNLASTIQTFYAAYASKVSQIDGRLDSAEGNITGLTTSVGALSGLVAGFTGSARNSIVNALNFVYSIQTGETADFTNATVSGTLGVGGASTFTGAVTVNNTFASRGILDNATATRLTIANGSITAGTNVSVTGTITGTGNITGANLLTGVNGSVNNNSGSRIEFSNGGMNLVAGSATGITLTSTLLTVFRNITTANDIAVTGSGNISIDGNQVWHAGNDGAGSGLDADLLDGLSSAHFLNYNNLNNRPTIGDGTITIAAGSGMSGGGSFTTNRTSNLTVTVNHAATSSVTNISTSGKTVISSLTFDSFGHVTARTTRALDFYTTGEADAAFAAISHTHAAGDITTGTFVDARIPSLDAGKTTTGVFNIARIPDIPASKVTGILDAARIPSLDAGKTTTGVFAVARLGTGIPSVSTFLRGDGSWAAVSQNVTDVLAGNGLTRSASGGNITLTLGTPGTVGSGSSNSSTASSHTHAISLVADDIPNLATSKITTGSFANARISQASVTQHQGALVLSAAQITSGAFANARISQASVTQHQAALSILWSQVGSTPTTLSGYGITDAAPLSRNLVAGNGLTGGGTLAADRTFTLGTPGTLTTSSTNAVTASSHTHEVNFPVTSVAGKTGAVSLVAADIGGTLVDGQLPQTMTGKTFSAQTIHTNGTVSAPGIRFGDTTSGFYRSGANEIAITISGAQRFRAQSSGIAVTGSVVATGDVEAFSDLRLKDVTGKITDPFNILNGINGVRYTWKKGIAWLDSSVPQVGVIAQDVETVLPEAVGDDGDGNKTVAYTKLIPVLIEAIKELEARVKELERGHN